MEMTFIPMWLRDALSALETGPITKPVEMPPEVLKQVQQMRGIGFMPFGPGGYYLKYVLVKI